MKLHVSIDTEDRAFEGRHDLANALDTVAAQLRHPYGDREVATGPEHMEAPVHLVGAQVGTWRLEQ